MANQETEMYKKYTLCEQLLDKITDTFLPGLFDDWVLLVRNRVEEQMTILVQSTISLLKKEGEVDKVNRLKKKVDRILQDIEELSESYLYWYEKEST